MKLEIPMVSSYNKTEWFYDAVSGFIDARFWASQGMQSRYMQVLLLTKTESNYLQMHTMQKLERCNR